MRPLTLQRGVVLLAVTAVSLCIARPAQASEKSPQDRGASIGLFGWGRDGLGQAGLPRKKLSPCSCITRPERVMGLAHVVQLAAAVRFSLALLKNGSVLAWGDNSKGALGIGSIKHHGCECVSHPVRIRGLHNIVAISATGLHALALSRNGSVWGWGDDYDGELGLGLVCKPTGSGCIYPPGCSCRTRPVRIPRLPPIRAISAGPDFSLVLDRTGHVWGWGADFQAQVGYGGVQGEECECIPRPVRDPMTNVKSIAAGGAFALALTASGGVLSWGTNERGQLGNGGVSFASCGCGLVAAPVPGLHKIASISAGKQSAFAVDSSGAVWAWGYNHWANLGSGQTGNAARTPERVLRSNRFRMVQAGAANGLGITTDGRLLLWGAASAGVLGDGKLYKGKCGCALHPVDVMSQVTVASIGTGQVIAVGRIQRR